jgi:hypothetical protein
MKTNMITRREPGQIIPQLPKTVAVHAGKAWAAYRADPGNRSGFSRHARDAFKAARFPEGDCVVPSTLTTTCRLLAELVTGWAGVDLASYGLPRTIWSRQRWLGLCPQTAVEREVAYIYRGKKRRAPLYRAVIELYRGGETKTTEKLIARLPLVDRLEVVSGFAFDCYHTVLNVGWIDFTTITAAAGPWALETAERFTALKKQVMEHTELIFGVEEELRRAIFLRLIRAGIAIKPRWDWLIPKAWSAWPPEAAEILESIPEPRRTRAIMRVLKLTTSTWAFRSGSSVLSHYPSRALVKFILPFLDDTVGDFMEWSRRDWLTAKTRELAAFPEIVALLRAHLARLPRLPELRLRRHFRPKSIKEFSPGQRRQFALIGGHWSADDERTFMVTGKPEAPQFGPIRFVAVFEIEDEGGRLIYEAISYTGGLHGAVFRAGTDEWIATMCQHSLDMRYPDQEPLLEALTKILGEELD